MATFSLDTSPSGRDVDGIEFGIAAETATPQFANLRSAGQRSDDTPEEQSYLAISAFCTLWSSEDLGADECHARSHALDTSQDHWTVWASGVVDFDHVVYRFNEEAEVFADDVRAELLALDAGCHELEIAEDGISTHWSLPYEFCFASSTDSPSNSALAAPTLRVTKIDIPAANKCPAFGIAIVNSALHVPCRLHVGNPWWATDRWSPQAGGLAGQFLQ